NLLAKLVIADPRTGKEVAVSEPGFFYSPAAVCDDDPDAACTTAWDQPTNTVVDVRIGGRASGTTGAGRVSLGRRVGEGGLTNLRGRDPERLGRIQNGRLTWSRPIADYFGPGATTDTGWVFFVDGDVYVGSVGHKDWIGGLLTLGQGSTAGFSALD